MDYSNRPGGRGRGRGRSLAAQLNSIDIAARFAGINLNSSSKHNGTDENQIEEVQAVGGVGFEPPRRPKVFRYPRIADYPRSEVEKPSVAKSTITEKVEEEEEKKLARQKSPIRIIRRDGVKVETNNIPVLAPRKVAAPINNANSIDSVLRISREPRERPVANPPQRYNRRDFNLPPMGMRPGVFPGGVDIDYLNLMSKNAHNVIDPEEEWDLDD